MKAHKRAIKFFEKYDIQTADRLLFELFTDWVKAVNPSIEIERTVYGHISDMRAFLRGIWRVVQSGKNSKVVFYLLPKTDTEILENTINKMLRDWNAEVRPTKKLRDEIQDFVSHYWDLRY